MVRFLEELENKPTEFKELAIIYGQLHSKNLLKLSTFIQPIEENKSFDGSNESLKNLLPAIKHIDLNPKECKTVNFLASNAYLMIETALHSDINQPTVIEQFAKKVRSIKKLDLLYLRSYSELRAVAPGTLTSWKKVLLSELYQRSHDYLKHPESLHSRSLTTWVEVYKILHWEFPPEDLELHFNNLPADYLETVKVEEAALHMRLTRSLKDKSFIFNHYYNATGKFHQVTLCCLTKFDAFKTLVGSLTAQNINILEAKIFARKDGIIIISTTIEQSERLAEDNLEIWKNLKQDLKSIFEGQKSLQKILTDRTRYASKEKPIKPRTSKVVIDNTSDSNFSIVRIEARDHIGMLYKISKVFADFKIQIHSAKISTQGGLGIDVFYISLQQKKLLLENIIRRIQEEIKLVMTVQRPEDID